jgi:hypothetical protein
MTAALEEGEWSAARPGCTLPPGKNRYPFYRRLGGPQGRSVQAENLVPTGIRSRTVQPVVSSYNVWTTRPTLPKTMKSKSKDKGHHRTGHDGPEVEYRYSSTLSLTSVVDGVGGQRHASAALPPGKTWYPLYRRLGGPQGLSGLVRKISPQPCSIFGLFSP